MRRIKKTLSSPERHPLRQRRLSPLHRRQRKNAVNPHARRHQSCRGLSSDMPPGGSDPYACGWRQKNLRSLLTEFDAHSSNSEKKEADAFYASVHPQLLSEELKDSPAQGFCRAAVEQTILLFRCRAVGERRPGLPHSARESATTTGPT